ncbi:MAG: aspartyl-tRNA(Asn)/glutamyl-tRNA(Gln) amidotransferase subunit C [Cellvibrionaceae bacterium]|jgi:aspartyl-tRNA(Asn)/glutamyl-tRNA(Gln) amidotransferase subunit C
MDAEQIRQLAKLTQINISDTTVSEVAHKLSDILQLIDQLQAADTSGVKAMAHPLDANQVLRSDEITESNQREALQASAPAVENGLFLVPKVID